MTQDPFSAPAPIASEFASADSFRNRIVVIQPKRLELDVPNLDGKLQDKVTADVTTVDGKGKVEIFAQKIGIGQYLEGPTHEGVWFSQDRVVKALCPGRQFVPGQLIIGRLETYKPGRPAGQGNPWGILEVTPAERAAAATEWVRIQTAAASAAMSAPAKADDNPF